MTGSYWECEACHARLIMAAAGTGHGKLLNWQLDPDGEYAVYQSASGGWHARKLTQGEQPEPYERRHSEHWTTSPKCRPPSDATRAAAAEVSDFLSDYRKAQAGHEKNKRNRRGRRTKPVTGIRIDPGRQP